ncbi:MAG TPA: hypothetical protein VJ521_03190, partial [Acidobacteriota bacterium]|nr:hypothetical protein [Acidobacteriota bacterium]
MSLEILIKIAGTLLLLLAATHCLFPKILDWKKELAYLSVLNRQIFLVHTFFIVLVLLGFGVLSLFCTDDLMAPQRLSRTILGGMAGFWFLRLIVQLFIYDSRLWRKNRSRTAAHLLLTAFWSFL